MTSYFYKIPISLYRVFYPLPPKETTTSKSPSPTFMELVDSLALKTKDTLVELKTKQIDLITRSVHEVFYPTHDAIHEAAREIHKDSIQIANDLGLTQEGKIYEVQVLELRAAVAAQEEELQKTHGIASNFFIDISNFFTLSERSGEIATDFVANVDSLMHLDEDACFSDLALKDLAIAKLDARGNLIEGFILQRLVDQSYDRKRPLNLRSFSLEGYQLLQKNPRDLKRPIRLKPENFGLENSEQATVEDLIEKIREGNKEKFESKIKGCAYNAEIYRLEDSPIRGLAPKDPQINPSQKSIRYTDGTRVPTRAGLQMHNYRTAKKERSKPLSQKTSFSAIHVASPKPPALPKVQSFSALPSSSNQPFKRRSLSMDHLPYYDNQRAVSHSISSSGSSPTLSDKSSLNITFHSRDEIEQAIHHKANELAVARLRSKEICGITLVAGIVLSVSLTTVFFQRRK